MRERPGEKGCLLGEKKGKTLDRTPKGQQQDAGKQLVLLCLGDISKVLKGLARRKVRTHKKIIEWTEHHGL